LKYIVSTLHETFPSLNPSNALSSDRIAYDVPDLSTSRTADLFPQPSCWRAELPRAVGLNPGECKASLTSSSTSTFKPSISSNYMAGNGMELLSEACAAVSTPKLPRNIFDERPIQPAIRYEFGRKTTSPSRPNFLSISRREPGDRGQGVEGVNKREEHKTKNTTEIL